MNEAIYRYTQQNLAKSNTCFYIREKKVMKMLVQISHQIHSKHFKVQAID